MSRKGEMAVHSMPQKKYPHFARKHPEARYWLKQGLQPRMARELAKAGFQTVEDLAGKSREELLAIAGLGEGALAKLERSLGSPIPSQAEYWVKRGLSRNFAGSLVRAGIVSVEELGRLTREQFLDFHNLAEGALYACERVLGRQLDSPRQYWRTHGLRAPVAHRLSRIGIRTLDDLAAQPDSTLRKAGLDEREVLACRAAATESDRPD